MVPLSRTALSLCVAASAAALACTPEEDPSPYVLEDTPIETDRGYFTLQLRGAEGRSWPEYAGPTTLALRIEAGALEGDDGGPAPPLTLTLDAPPELFAKAWPITKDGFKWLLALEFAPGDWALGVTIEDAQGHGDETTLVFHVEDEPRGRSGH